MEARQSLDYSDGATTCSFREIAGWCQEVPDDHPAASVQTTLRFGSGDQRLSRTTTLWLTSQEALSEKQRQRMDDDFALQLKTHKAREVGRTRTADLRHEPVDDACKVSGQWHRRVIPGTLQPARTTSRPHTFSTAKTRKGDFFHSTPGRT